MRLLPIALTTVLALTLAGTSAAGAADAERGRLVYEAKCGGCHNDSVHGREKRVAHDFEEVRGWVLRWSANLGLAWTNDEVDDVTVHLNARYYRFRCPASVCSATGMRGGTAPAVAASGVKPAPPARQALRLDLRSAPAYRGDEGNATEEKLRCSNPLKSATS
jgi:hypothetical protein